MAYAVNRWHLLATEGLSPYLRKALTGLPLFIKEFDFRGRSIRIPLSEAHKTEILFIRSSTRIDAAQLANFPRLRIVVRAGVGLDHIDQNLCRQRRIKIIHSPAASTQSVAELTLMLALEALRCARLHREAFQRGFFRAPHVRGRELSGIKAGIIGLGRIGGRVARLLSAFGAEVCATDPYRSEAYFRRHRVKRRSFDGLVEESQILFLHCPLTEETFHLINKRAISKMPSGVVVVNTARGGLVDEHAILRALRDERWGAYAVDVLEREPPLAKHPLLKHERVLWLPHLGAQTNEAQQRQDEDLVMKLKNVLKKE